MRLRAAHRRGSTSARAAPRAASMQVPRSINALFAAFGNCSASNMCVETSLKAVIAAALNVKRRASAKHYLAQTH